MKTFVFYGYSDDCLEIEGAERQEKSAPDGCAWVVLRSPSEGSLIVGGVYSPSPLSDTWLIGVCPIAEDAPIPQWRFSYATHRYSTELTIQCPDDTELDMCWEK